MVCPCEKLAYIQLAIVKIGKAERLVDWNCWDYEYGQPARIKKAMMVEEGILACICRNSNLLCSIWFAMLKGRVEAEIAGQFQTFKFTHSI